MNVLTAEKVSDSLAAAVVATVRQPLVVLDGDFRVQMANAAFYDVFAASKFETVGQPFFELGNGQWKVPSLLEALTSILPFRREITDFEIEHTFPRIGRKIMVINARELEGEGRSRMILVAIEDVTAVRKAARELERKGTELARSNRDLEQFAFVASHDLQEPLRKIRTFGDLLTKSVGDALSGEASDYLERMTNATVRMSNLLTDLLGFARARVRPAKLMEVDLAVVCEEATVDLDATVKLSGATIDIGPLPVVYGDASQLRQLFQNLLSNALKYRKPDVSPQIEVSASSVEANGGEGTEKFFEIVVRDNGIGFENGYASVIFEPFRRLHGRFEYQGNGIGLSICRTIVERHGGTIEAAGIADAGATFTITLPAGRPIEEAQ